MTVSIYINGHRFEGASYQVSEDVSSLTAGDSGGSVGTFTVTTPRPDMFVSLSDGYELLGRFGPDFFLETNAVIEDSERGIFRGTVRAASRNDANGTFTFEGVSWLDKLNVYNVEAKPFSGTLGEAIQYYVGLSKSGVNVAVDSSVSSRPVHYIGWTGELWFRLKQLATAQDCEIALVDNTVRFRPVRRNTLIAARDISRSGDRRIGSLAQTVEVYNYNTSALSLGPVYPIDGWSPELEVLNVNAGEEAEYQLELSASVSSIETPEMKEFVSPDTVNESVYTVVANDGLPIPPQQWKDYGGRVEFEINPDTISLTARLWGPVSMPSANGDYATNFSLALASDETANRYSTLRLRGTGVRFGKKPVQIRTGLSPQETGTEIGVTIDNPFLVDENTVYRAGTRAAAGFAHAVPAISGKVTVAHADNTPDMGYTAGTRVYDLQTHRNYRIRTGRIAPDGVDFDAEDDLTFGDLTSLWNGKTWAQVTSGAGNFTFRQMDVAGWDV